ncbi:hypothetical protein BSM4216_3750 [Bacillus smithii]|nr:hypothetical protein BSM4216_3750 [Bacillus smithii]
MFYFKKAMIARKSSIATNTYQTNSTQKSQPTSFTLVLAFIIFLIHSSPASKQERTDPM